ncbi:hypothetical protein HBI40_075180 [Parastagonospora nodorum]|nr:hypothetical protein HBH51_085330 [Parastagonospora nodorum]KAH4223262.1 hypothetical protein HBI06_133060 [Parastagonospora nodorum]KAH4233790.1 hypothetical protein HBI05_163030 [Parastagonospora nodorum]KAH4603798.1 hypothetical protein HBH82_141820 [Parastagonospora nodorum]KAH4701177.1 hypothetical protein HBH78_062110 [Parastagonospora nodorum]
MTIDMTDDPAIQYIFDLGSREPIPTHIVNHIKQKGPKLGVDIYKKWDNIRAIESMYGDKIQYEWSKMTLKDRRGILVAARTNIPKIHRPECFTDTYTPYIKPKGIPTAEHTLPYLNQEDLEAKSALPTLFRARGRQSPATFAMRELVFIPVGYPKADIRQSTKLCLSRRDTYGDMAYFSTVDEAIDFELVLPKLDLRNLSPPDSDVESPDLPLFELRLDTDHEDLVAKAPLRPRPAFVDSLPRVRHLISTQTSLAELDLWQLREDPSRFVQIFNDVVEHDPRQLLDKYGKRHPVIGTDSLVSSTLHVLVAQSHYVLMFWDQLGVHLQVIEDLMKAHLEGLNISSFEPDALSETIMSFSILLDDTTNLIMLAIEHYQASPEFRVHHRRRILLGQNTVAPEPSLAEDTVRLHVANLLHDLIQGHKEGALDPYRGLRFRLDLLETFLRKFPSGWTWISPYLRSALAKLSVLAGCSLAFELQLWYEKQLHVASMYTKNDPNYLSKVYGPFKAWTSIFKNVKGADFISSSKLGDPSDNKFDYPISSGRNKKIVVEKLCRAEAKLDAFWISIDADLEKWADGHPQKTLQRLLDNGGDMLRTQPWSKRHEEWAADRQGKGSKSAPPDLLLKSEPLSRIFHDASKEITGIFNKSNIITKTKAKIRPEGGPDGGLVDPRRDPSPEPQVTLPVNKKGLQVFSRIFYNPETNENPAGDVKWSDFKGAMASVGFSAEHMHGSQWQFNPAAHLNLTRGIAFHEPHPSPKFSHDQARGVGARLHRAYGWVGSMFVRKREDGE